MRTSEKTVVAAVVVISSIVANGRMVYDYSQGPAWRQAAGLSAETWVEDSASYDYDTNDQDLIYARQAKVIGSTANYLMFKYSSEISELTSAVRCGDAKRVVIISDRIRKFTDEHRDSLVEWSAVSNGKGRHADQFAKNANSLLSEQYLDIPVRTFADAFGECRTMSARDLIESKSGRSKSLAVEKAQKTFGISKAAATVYLDEDSPFHCYAFDMLRHGYENCLRAQSVATTPAAVASANESVRLYANAIKQAAEFVAGHTNKDPGLIGDFLLAWPWDNQKKIKGQSLDVLFSRFETDKEEAIREGREMTPALWFSSLTQRVRGYDGI